MKPFDLFPQGVDGLLDICKVHGLHIADDRHDESLQMETILQSMQLKLPVNNNQMQQQRSEVKTFGVATATPTST